MSDMRQPMVALDKASSQLSGDDSRRNSNHAQTEGAAKKDVDSTEPSLAYLWSKRDWTSIAGLLGGLLCLTYFLRCSIVTLVDIASPEFWFNLNYVALLCCALWIVSTIWRIRWPALCALVASAAGILNAQIPRECFLKWAAWCALVVAVGPLIASKKAALCRQSSWRTTRLLLVLVGVSSAFWFLFNLPVMGKGRFTGVTIHSNLSGPLAGLAVLISFIVAIHRRSWKWGVIAAVCSLPCIVSGSRAGLVALGVAALVVLLVRFRLNQAAVLVAILGFVTYFLLDRGVFNMPSLQTLTSYLREKGLANTREHLWEARLYEFRQHPWIGIGVGMAEGAGGGYLEDNRFNVEPGSSYLAVLAMTGIVGVTGFAITILYMAITVARSFPAFSPQNQAEILGVAAFLAVHALAEGWILAVGSPFTFLFWLICGRALDLADSHGEAPQPRGKEHKRRSRRAQRKDSAHSSDVVPSLPRAQL